MRKHFHLLLLLLLFLSCRCFAQEKPQEWKRSVYFNSGEFKVPATGIKELALLTDSLIRRQPLTIELVGNTDNAGSYELNWQLSEKRAGAVKAVLTRYGIDAGSITTRGAGPDNPIASNNTTAGRQQNRRVDIIVSAIEIKDTRNEIPVPDIAGLFSKLERAPEIFCISRYKDTVIRCKQGTVIYIKANSLIPKSNCGNACITFKVREAFLKSDMILDNLSTTSDGLLLESQGMLYTEATDCNGNKLDIQQGKDLVIVVPVDSIDARAKIFDGNRAHDSIMNWTVNNNSILSEFTLPELDVCGAWFCAGVKRTIDCKPCAFFFCRMGRIGKTAGGLFSRRRRAYNRDFRACQKELKLLEDSSSTVISNNPTVVLTRPPLDSNLLPKCKNLESLFKKYGVDNMQSLLLAINKPLLDSFRISSMEELKDTLAKLATQKIELSYLDRKVSFSDFKYYVYNSSRLGWSNVDCFSDIPESEKVTLKVNLQAERNIDCKLVFKNRRSVMPATKEAGSYEFKGVPRGEQVFIVAVKYEEGKPFLAMRELAIAKGSFDVEFKELTLEELKTQLKLLDRSVK